MVDIWIMATSAARRDWLLRSVGNEPSIRVARAAATFPFLRSLAAEASADLAVIDLQSPMEPSAVHNWLAEFVDLVPMLLLSSEPEPAIFNRMMNREAGGMLPVDASAEQIVQAIKSIAAGSMVFDGALMRQMLRGSDSESLSEPVETLTPRETEVLGLLADGLGNREIAARLGISEHTIKFHIRSILAKLGASSRTEAVSRGLRGGLIEL
jgi:DNA-binding NarL/FixJ family response regulator